MQPVLEVFAGRVTGIPTRLEIQTGNSVGLDFVTQESRGSFVTDLYNQALRELNNTKRENGKRKGKPTSFQCVVQCWFSK